MSDKTMSADDVVTRLRNACRSAGGQSRWATKHGVSPQYVSDVLADYRAPGDKILRALGIIRVVRYEPDPRSAP